MEEYPVLSFNPLYIQKLVKAAQEADEFFRQNDDFTEMGEYPVPGFIQDLRNALSEVTK